MRAKCPECGARLTIEPGVEQTRCECGRLLKVRAAANEPPRPPIDNEDPEEDRFNEPEQPGLGNFRDDQFPNDEPVDEDFDDLKPLAPVAPKKRKPPEKRPEVAQRKAKSTTKDKPDALAELFKSPIKLAFAGIGALVGVLMSRLMFAWILGGNAGGILPARVANVVQAGASEKQENYQSSDGYLVMTEPSAVLEEYIEGEENWDGTFEVRTFPPATSEEFGAGLPEAAGTAPPSPRPEGLLPLRATQAIRRPEGVGGQLLADVFTAHPLPETLESIPMIKCLPLLDQSLESELPSENDESSANSPAPADIPIYTPNELVVWFDWRSRPLSGKKAPEKKGYPIAVGAWVSLDDQLMMVESIHWGKDSWRATGPVLTGLILMNREGQRIATIPDTTESPESIAFRNALPPAIVRLTTDGWHALGRRADAMVLREGRLTGWSVEEGQLTKTFERGDKDVLYSTPVAAAWGRDWLVMPERPVAAYVAAERSSKSPPDHFVVVSSQDGRILLRTGMPTEAQADNMSLVSLSVAPDGEHVAAGYAITTKQPGDRNRTRDRKTPVFLVVDVGTGNRTVLKPAANSMQGIDGANARITVGSVALVSGGMIATMLATGDESAGMNRPTKLLRLDVATGKPAPLIDSAHGSLNAGFLQLKESAATPGGRSDVWIAALDEGNALPRANAPKYQLEVHVDVPEAQNRVAQYLARLIVKSGGVLGKGGHILRVKAVRGPSIKGALLRVSQKYKEFGTPTIHWEWELLDSSRGHVDRGLHRVENTDIERFKVYSTDVKRGQVATETVTLYKLPPDYQDLMYKDLLTSEVALFKGLSLVQPKKDQPLRLRSSREQLSRIR